MTVERYDRPANMPALINPTTDSWTAVLANVIDLANNITNTEFVPQGLRGSIPKVVAAILHGRELGLPPMTALAHTSVINGRPGTSAEVMRALILQAGHDLHIEYSDSQKCTIRGRRADWPEDRWTTVSFTIQDAAKAGLTEDKRTKEGKTIPSMYKKWPTELLLARASTRLARMVFADVIHGMRSVEELQDMTEVGEWVEPTQLPTTAQVSRQSAGNGQQAQAGEPEPVVAPSAPVAEAQAVAESEQQPATPATSGRKRAPLTKRGQASAPAPVEQPAVADEDGVVDSEVIEEARSPAEPTSIADVKKALRQKAVVSVQMQFERILGKPVDREERLWWTGIIVGHPVESTNALTSDEIRAVQARLERFRDRVALEKALGSAAPAQEGGE